jgi:glycosyltransferase involved in cell wall biosynthesis
LLVETLEDIVRIDTSDRRELVARAAAGLDAGGDPELWLALAVLYAELPTRDEVVSLRRIVRTRGSTAGIEHLLRPRTPWERIAGGRSNSVHVLRDTVVVDVHHTARTGLATGIQRVVRETIKRWADDRRMVLVGWNDLYHAIRELGSDEKRNALTGGVPHARRPRHAEVLVPWRSLYFLPELAIEPQRTQRIQALAEFSGNRTAVIGFDCVPLTSAETTGAGMGSAFAKNLRAVAQMDRVVAISSAAATEYEGWRRMLAGIGLAGPAITEVLLPDDVGSPTEAQLAEARIALGVTEGVPLLICVGSHEPRKNHVAVLSAAERLWRQGRDFRLVFIGGNSWRSEQFSDELRILSDRGRPVAAVSAISDGLLWSAYRLATATIFPSLNEGYGLPVGESLASGTPVVTSDYGSMKEVAQGGGAVLVNPRDDLDIARGIETVLFDAPAQAELRRAAAIRPRRNWGDYATEIWDLITAAPRPAP